MESAAEVLHRAAPYPTSSGNVQKGIRKRYMSK